MRRKRGAPEQRGRIRGGCMERELREKGGDDQSRKSKPEEGDHVLCNSREAAQQ